MGIVLAAIAVVAMLPSIGGQPGETTWMVECSAILLCAVTLAILIR